MHQNRRATLAASSSSQPTSSQESQIPMPASAMRRPTTLSRQSMAPGLSASHAGYAAPRQSMAPSRTFSAGAPRASIAPPSFSQEDRLAPPSTVARATSYAGYASQSGVKHDGILRGNNSQPSSQSYAPPSVRRSSVYSTLGGRQSSIPGTVPAQQRFHTSNKKAVDQRPIRDPKFREACVNHITEWLNMQNYHVTTKMLQQPTTKDFQNIFKFIYAEYDPSSRSKQWLKKFEDEVPALLKAAGYPYADTISKSHLQAVGAIHSWPGMLAMLDWFVAMIEAREEAVETCEEVQLDPNAPKTQQGLERPQALLEMLCEFLNDAYPVFLASEDYDISPMEDRLTQRYDQYAEKTIQNTARLQAEAAELDAELNSLSSASNGALQRHINEEKHLQRDIKTMETYLSSLEANNRKASARCNEFKQKIADLEALETTSKAEKSRLETAIAAQGLSESDVHRMTSEQKSLDEQMRSLQAKRDGLSATTYDLEIAASQAYNRVERLTEEYTAQATKLGLIPIAPAPYSDIDFSLELNGSAENPAHVIPDHLPSVRNAIASMKSDTTEERRRIATKLIEVEDELKILDVKLEKLEHQYAEKDRTWRTIEANLAEARETLTLELQTMDSDADRLQSIINSLRNSMSGGASSADQRLSSLKNERERLIGEIDRQRKENESELTAQLEAIISYKTYVVGRIEEMQGTVADMRA